MLNNLLRTQYVKTLEERLKKTESLLIAAGLLDEESIGYDDLSGDDEEQSEDDSDTNSDPGYAPLGSGRNSGDLTGDDESRDMDYMPGDRDPLSIPCTNDPVKPLRPSHSEAPSRKGKKRPHPCANSQQCCPPIRGDSKEDSRYYGISSRVVCREVTMLTTYFQDGALPCRYYRVTGLSGSRIRQAEQQLSLLSFPTQIMIALATTGGPTSSTTCFLLKCSNRCHLGQKFSPCSGTISAQSTDCFRCTMKSHSCS